LVVKASVCLPNSRRPTIRNSTRRCTSELLGNIMSFPTGLRPTQFSGTASAAPDTPRAFLLETGPTVSL
jgi:hypothetical protein